MNKDSQEYLQDFFIKSTVYKNHFINVMKETKDTIEYGLKSGLAGACIFKKEAAEQFLATTAYTGIEMIQVKEALNPKK